MIWWLKKQFLRIKLFAAENYQNEAESLVIWYAVCYALGIAFYMTTPWELPIWLIVVLLEAVLILLYLEQNHRVSFKLLTYVAIFILGICFAKADALYRQRKIADNIEEISYLSGHIEDLSYNAAHHPRLILNNVNNFEHELKGKFKITLNQNPQWLKRGKCVELVVKLPQSYQENPLENYNFARSDFYQDISASGYTIGPVFEKDCEIKSSSFHAHINSIRDNIKETIDTHTSSEQRGIIKALTIGDKSDISKPQYKNYRLAGIAHILAISGMHMGMIALLAFLLIRIGLLPFGQGRYDLRKPAAVVAIGVSLAYFLISGQSVSCIRAFVMTTLILLAILCNRRAITLRLWAIALLVVITLNPVSVVSPGFLMSFAAALGLITFYEQNASKLKKWYISQSILGKISIYFVGIILTDLVASLITLPYSIYYFHQISIYTTLGNLLAAPIVAFWIMPAVLLFLISYAFPFSTYILKFLALGIDVLNNIATWVANLSGVSLGEGIGQMPDGAILLITLGILWLCIWQARWRYLGIPVILIGLVGQIFTLKADFIFDKGGKTFACRTQDGRLSPTPWHKNKFFIYLWTGQELQNSKNYNKKGLICDKQKCICQDTIEFRRGQVIFNKKEVDLHQAGYINLKQGVVQKQNKSLRIWNKK